MNIDLAVGYDPTAPPDRVAPSNRLTQLRFASHDYLLYPLADQVSDKVCATLQLYGERQRPSSREKDLVDLTLIASFRPLDAAQLRVALATEFRRRGLEPIDAFTVPSHWGAAYRRLAGATALSTIAPTVVDAFAVTSRLLDPILDVTVTSGTWDPARRIWDLYRVEAVRPSGDESSAAAQNSRTASSGSSSPRTSVGIRFLKAKNPRDADGHAVPSQRRRTVTSAIPS